MKKRQRTTQKQRNYLRRKAIRSGLRPRDWSTGYRRYERDSVPCPEGYGSWNAFSANQK